MGSRLKTTLLAAGLLLANGGERAPMRLSSPLQVAPGDTLRLEAGTVVEVGEGSGIVVSRGAVILAEGTPLAPVVIRCVSAAPAACGETLVVLGRSPLNHGTGTSPDGGCLEAGSPRPYGGCDPTDSSGILRSLRVEGGGVRFAGVGSGTVVDRLQVDRAPGDGVAIVGGTLDLRRVYVTGAAGSGLAWSGGWTGRAQYVAVVSDPAGFAAGISGTAAPGAPAATPADGPHLHNISVLAPSGGSGSDDAPALRFSGGAGGVLGNVLLIRPAAALDLDDGPTCEAAASGALVLAPVLVSGPAWLGSPDPDPVECAAWGVVHAEASWLVETGATVLTHPSQVDGLVRDAPGAQVVDLSPPGGSAALAGGAAPPDDGFFHPSSTWFGAFGPGLPWSLGWVRLDPALVLPGEWPGIRTYGAEFLLDVDVTGGGVSASLVSAGPLGAGPALGPGAAGPQRSVLGSDVIQIIPGSLSASSPGEHEPGKIRLTFDVSLVNRLSHADLITATFFPVVPAGVQGVLLIPFQLTLLTTAGGRTVEIPAGDRVTASPSWDGEPHDFFSGLSCAVDPDDCFRWEPFTAPLRAGTTSEVRTVGFDIDLSVTSFRSRVLVAADVVDSGS